MMWNHETTASWERAPHEVVIGILKRADCIASQAWAPYGALEGMQSKPCTVLKQLPHRLGHPVGYPLQCGPC